MRRALGPLFATALLSLLSPSQLHANPLDTRLVQILSPKRAPHPLASPDGRIGLTVTFPNEAAARSAGVLPLVQNTGLLRLFPQEIEAFSSKHPDLSLAFSPPLHQNLDIATSRSNALAYRNATGLDASNVVVGIIDTGVDVTHPDLRDANGKSRVAWLLDLSRNPLGKHADLEESFGCNAPSTPCAVFQNTDIDEAMNSTLATGTPRDQVGHGTHVASIAAGNGLGSTDQRYAGMAPTANLVVVSVFRQGATDISDADVVLATRFVFDRAKQMKMPAVVNISLGSDFGAHDGSSVLEQSLAAFVGPDQPGRAIVVAGGNSGGIYISQDFTLGIHTEARIAPGATAEIPMLSPTPSTRNTVRGSVWVWIKRREGNSLSVGLRGPDGKMLISQVSSGNAVGYSSDSGITSAGIVNDIHDSDSTIPAGTQGAVVYFTGEWQAGSEISITLEGDATADLWLQGSGDASPGAAGIGQQFLRATKHSSVNLPATHPSLIGVGASINRVMWTDAAGASIPAQLGNATIKDDSIAYFSGAGPTSNGLMKPDITAPGAFVVGAMSRDARPSINPSSMFATTTAQCPSSTVNCYVVDDYHAVASGTSMASPLVAGAVALLFARDASLTQQQILTLLQAGARYPQGNVPFDFQMGPGVLDVEGARLAYEIGGQPIDSLPDSKASWLVMGSPYIRIASDWPVWGTLETRTETGTIADGFDQSQLKLNVDHAAVVSPLTRIAPGLWRFSISSVAGTGFSTAHVSVTYQGKVLGQQHALPIGADYFAAWGGTQARGGCAMAPCDERTNLDGIFAAIMLGAAWLNRRNRSIDRKQ